MMQFRYSGRLSGQGEAMVELHPGVVRAIAARHEGRPEDALAILIGLFAGICKDEAFAGKIMFIVLFEWQMLAGEYAPARDVLARSRPSTCSCTWKARCPRTPGALPGRPCRRWLRPATSNAPSATCPTPWRVSAS